ncbi:hypothetical protein [Nonomuraea sediminis]|uniref:hypothetical protein n=1 Tax=Nonomuraea sediminis TaxID=2835864 RepID=UPI001BDBFA89|nr:hypothetical protein [Nonomuraea sediminis]
MGNLYEYFSAADDASAMTAFETGAEDAGFASLGALKGIGPDIGLGKLEAVLTGLSFDQISQDPRFADVITSETEGEGTWIVALTDRLRDGLAGVTPDQLLPIAERWAATYEYVNSEPDLLADFLGRLVDLAVQAQVRKHRLYCWLSL